MRRLYIIVLCFVLIGCVQHQEVSFEQNHIVFPITEISPVIFVPVRYKFQITQTLNITATGNLKIEAQQNPKKRVLKGETKITSIDSLLFWDIRIKEITEDDKVYKYFKPIVKYHIITKRDGEIENKEVFFPAISSDDDNFKNYILNIVDKILKSDVLFHLHNTGLKTGDQANLWATSRKMPPVNVLLASVISEVTGKLLWWNDDLGYKIDGITLLDDKPILELSIKKTVQNNDGFFSVRGQFFLNRATLQPIKSSIIFECKGGDGADQFYGKETTTFKLL